MDLIAQSSTNLGDIRGIGPLGLEGIPAGFVNIIASYTLNRLVAVTIGIMTIFAGIWFIILLITAAYSWMNAGGDKVAIENARQRMIHAVVGLVIVIAAIFIVDLVGNLLGFPYLTDPATFILFILTP